MCMKNFYVVLNGCKSIIMQPTKDIRSLYQIGDVFLFAFVGNIGDCKNQKQVVDAFSLLSAEERKKIKVVFVGGGEVEMLRNYIKSKCLSDYLIVCGSVPQDDVHNFYCAANATILTSKSEGFGLSIIEGMRYGLPNLVFSDLPAVTDLYDECAMLTIDKRTDEELSKKMVEMTECVWNRDAIKKHSDKFTLEEMANNYIQVYKNL